MLPDRTDPERRFSIEERIMTACSQLERGAMTLAVFRARVFGCGLRGEQIETLVRTHGNMVPISEVPIVRGFVSGLR